MYVKIYVKALKNKLCYNLQGLFNTNLYNSNLFIRRNVRTGRMSYYLSYIGPKLWNDYNKNIDNNNINMVLSKIS